MASPNKLKIFNDPIYGFIPIPSPLIFDLIDHPYFQRLRRISQMGLSYLVYPGAHHTRFHHALGSMYLMQRAVQVLQFKGVAITDREREGLFVAILLHDIGHGPFSHAMEHSLAKGVDHEYISLQFMKALNEQFKGKLSLAIAIFTGKHPKKFLNQLVSSQLDMDRLDYLKRDSFYTGVAEGNTNAERLITMLNVVDGHLVVEEKGIYSVEKFLLARRFMYWQVYLHKTGVAAEQLLINILKRARELMQEGGSLSVNGALRFFLENQVNRSNFDAKTLQVFSELDDIDILSALKQWRHHPDRVLSRLCGMVIDRNLQHIKLRKEPMARDKFQKKFDAVRKKYQLSTNETSYFVFRGKVSNRAYDKDRQNINILKKNGNIRDVAKLSDNLVLTALAETVTKYYVCYPKDSI
ncbi:HD domain-containing protein [Maribacter sp. 2307ULW6-5]|uniref:HD domain-containing protein n=1 Tax=Maribacter sp. 2307ULW6-5 TaxID=3386275 RepID=UPI0039BC4068